MVRVAINGFGRIGRNVLRAAWERPDIHFAHINDLTKPDMLAYLLAHDSVHGNWGHDVRATDAGIVIDGDLVPVTAEKDPAALPWAAADVDVVLECTGLFTGKAKCAGHLSAGARKVIISAPGDKDVDGTFVVGVNDQTLDPERHVVVSNASCTTNCLAPLVAPLVRTVGVEHGLMTTVHSYTMDQSLLDTPHRKGKFRRARAAAVNMVPTETGAAKAIGLVLPELAGRLNGLAIRVPTPNVSLVDLVFTAKRDTSREEINQILRDAAAGPLSGILVASDEELVSSDLIGNPASSIADLGLTDVIAGRMVKVLAWYDNEWGFSNRMADLAVRLSRR
jgi:glyceraldehyde 3-phosphate dehydrogenase